MPSIFISYRYPKNIFFRSFLTLVICLNCFFLIAQKKQRPNSTFPNSHLKHIVLPHQTFNSIGKSYGLTGEEIADYNNLEYYDGDVIPKYLTIPLTKRNSSIDKIAFTNEHLVPLFQIKGIPGRLIRYKKNGNNPLIRRVNGSPLLVGYLHTNEVNNEVVETVVPAGIRHFGQVKQAGKKAAITDLKPAITIAIAVPQKALASAVVGGADTVSAIRAAIVLPKIVNSSSTLLKEKRPALVEIKKPQPRPATRERKVLFLVEIQLAITFFLLVIIFFVAALRNRKEVLHTQLKASIRKVLINEVLREETFSENLNRSLSTSDFLKKQMAKKGGRQFIIDEIINGRKSIKGKAGEEFLKLYVSLNMNDDSSKKLKSKNWNDVVKGIQELAIMEQNHKMTEIFHEINSRNELIRMEAQCALVRLSGFGGLWFLNVLNYPISEWQQMKLLSMLSTLPFSDIPDLHLLLTSPNESSVIFTLKLIGLFQQRTMHGEVIKCLANKNETIRFFAIKCLKEIHNEYTVDILLRKFATESRKNKISIVKVMGEIGSQDQLDFLLDVLSVDDDTLKISAAKALSKLGAKGNYLLEEYCGRRGGQYSQIFLHIKSGV
ncbi:HEAT repeat domain-containing protein [Segetibacter aerophilus]|uniref:LysM domain-containing protein n=1 Tax=Segetibacter aerophilus TaxID=670293 RepID=A0A512BA45_9BACT|nr:HEAT repeat domain-containing protein [Segetibacter aerophilus]GEO08832.1 hypothetical protein SAE01_13280 [Segetibacter aerophilus]